MRNIEEKTKEMTKFFPEEKIKYIVKKQCQICLKEFMRNYDKSEMTRVALELCAEDNSEEKVFEKELQNMVIDPKYNVRVSSTGAVLVDQPAEDGIFKNDPNVRLQVGSFFPIIETPYAYVMGKKVGKKVMQEFVSKYEFILEG